MSLESITKNIAEIAHAQMTGHEFHFQVRGNPPHNFQLSMDSFGFADQKETRVVLTMEITSTKEAIARFVTLSNPFGSPWYEENNARLSMHEEFISITFPPEIASAEPAFINHAIQKIVGIQEALNPR